MTNKLTIKITSVIVCYQPDLECLKRLLTFLKDNTDNVIVIDNDSDCQQEIKDLCQDIRVIPLNHNLGLGAAHNLGIEYARMNKSSHVLLLDQDSLPTPNMIDEMKKCCQLLADHKKPYCAIGARYRLHGDKTDFSDFVTISWFRFTRTNCTDKPYVKADFLISSGTLFSLDVLDKIGLMDESLFIDHIDTEWFMRARHHGYTAYGCCAAHMDHDLGEKHTKIWFGRWRLVPSHKPFRYYYIFRNSLLLYKRNYLTFKWKLADVVRLSQITIFFGMLSNNRVANLKMICQGIVAGIKGKSGKRS